MKKALLITAAVFVWTVPAHAQRQTDPAADPAGAKTRTTKPAATAGTVAPAPAATPAKPTAAKVVYVPVPVPPAPAWNKADHPYAQRHHRSCHEKSHNLYRYERHAAADGHLSPREYRTIDALKRDLDRTCGRHRWRG
jgi:hypothetical protein